MNASWLNCTEVAPGCWAVRFLKKPNTTGDPMPDFCAVCTVVICGPECRIHAMLGTVRRVHLRALKEWLQKLRIEWVWADRASGSRLPGAERSPSSDMQRIHVDSFRG